MNRNSATHSATHSAHSAYSADTTMNQLTLPIPFKVKGAVVLRIEKSGKTANDIAWAIAIVALKDGRKVQCIIWKNNTHLRDGVRLCTYNGVYKYREVKLVGDSSSRLIRELHLFP